MVILGLTGSIGMGKSTAGDMLRRMGVPVYDADAGVHALMARHGAAVARVAELFPDVIADGAVDRRALAPRVFADRRALAQLEAIIHPLVRRQEETFLKSAARHGARLVVLDIPLLFETGGAARCDATVLVTAPPFVQAARVLARPDMTPERLEAIRRRQMSEAQKRRRADFVVSTGLDKGATLRQLRRIVKLMRGRRGRHWPPVPRSRHARDCP